MKTYERGIILTMALWIALCLVAPARAQFGNATSIQGVRVKAPLGCSNAYVLTYVAASNEFQCLTAGGGGSPGGSNKQVQFNDSGAFGGNSGLTFDKATGIFTIGTTFSIDGTGGAITGTGAWNAAKVGLAYGGTNADLSATGGTSQFLKQSSSGAAITVARPACADLSNAAASCATDATVASNIGSGTLPTGRLSGTYAGVTSIANYYTSSTFSGAGTSSFTPANPWDVSSATQNGTILALNGQFAGADNDFIYFDLTNSTPARTHYGYFFVNNAVRTAGAHTAKMGLDLYNAGADNQVQTWFGNGDIVIGATTDGNYRLDVGKSGSSGSFRVKDQTASTGATSVLFDLGAAQTVASVIHTNNGSAAVLGDYQIRHQLAHSTTHPTLTSGTGTIDAVSADDSGRVTLSAGSQTTITITFGVAYTTNIPVCTAFDETTAANNPIQPQPTLSTLVLNATGTFGSADKISWSCRGYL